MANFPKELWDKVSSTVIPSVQKMLSALGEIGLSAFKTSSAKGEPPYPMNDDSPKAPFPSSPPSLTSGQTTTTLSGSHVSDPNFSKQIIEKQKLPGAPLLTKYEKERIFAKGILELAGQRGPNDPVLAEAEAKINPEATLPKETSKPSGP